MTKKEKIEFLKEQIKLLNEEKYNKWAIGYIQDLNSPNEIRECDCLIEEVIQPVIDFLNCRIIELEDDKIKLIK